jgi:hypothetical protein
MTNIVSALRVTPTGRPSVQRRPNRQHLDMTALQRVRNLPHVLPLLLGRTATTRPRRSVPLSSSSRLNSEWPSDWLPWASRRQPRLASRLSNALSARRKSERQRRLNDESAAPPAPKAPGKKPAPAPPASRKNKADVAQHDFKQPEAEVKRSENDVAEKALREQQEAQHAETRRMEYVRSRIS